MRFMERSLLALLAAGLLAGGLWLVGKGLYGLTLFVVLPVAVGALGSAWMQSTSPGRAASVGAMANLIGSSLFLLMGIEGLICIAMSVPLAIPLGALGGWLEFQFLRPGRASTAMLALLPLGGGALGFDVAAKPPVFQARTSMDIAAPPETVWKHLLAFRELPAPEEWYFKSGIAYPMRARIEGQGVGAVRYCEFSTGPFVEPIVIWDEPRLLRFKVTENPAPMHEWSPYGRVLPKHLHGYLVSKQGQFRLIPITGGGTRLEGTTWYQHGLWPAQYWRWWSDAVIHRIHLCVLAAVRQEAEQDR